jgi:hypothetical protein
MTQRNLVALGLSLVLLVVTACEFGPSGPGTLVARVSGGSLGGAVVEVVGVGIRGFGGRGSTQTYAAPVPGRRDAFRVILIDPEAEGDIIFEVLVDNVRMEGPVMTVLSAAGNDNATQMVASIEVRVER